MSAELTPRQQRILDYIRRTVATRRYPPSVREIGDAVGLRSTSSVHAQLGALEQAGVLRRDPSRPRAMEVLGDADEPAEPPSASATQVPLVGEIAAGQPILADEQIEDVYPLPRDLVGEGTVFMLRVRGESMVQAGVLDGDLVVVREQPVIEQGQMCAALVEGEATVKFFRRTPAGGVFLDPAADGYEPIPVASEAEAAILGRVVAVLRRV